MNNGLSQTEDTGPGEPVHTPRLWIDGNWTARVVKNEDDEGWAVEMTRGVEREPALVGPWTMGRDKKNPKPLDANAFNTLVKTASEFIRRQEQQRHAILHKEVALGSGTERIVIALDIVPDDDDPHAILSAHDFAGEPIAQRRVPVSFKLGPANAAAWVEGGYSTPASG